MSIQCLSELTKIPLLIQIVVMYMEKTDIILKSLLKNISKTLHSYGFLKHLEKGLKKTLFLTLFIITRLILLTKIAYSKVTILIIFGKTLLLPESTMYL